MEVQAMPLELISDQQVQFTIVCEHGTMVQVLTTAPLIDHFLRRVKVNQSEHTWVNYAHDLKVFFAVLCQPLEQIDRHSCIAFMEQQDHAGLSSLTINRRLAAVSSLFTELNLVDPAAFPRNPVAPLQRNRETRKRTKSLYRRQPDRVPDVVAEKDLQTFFEILPSWRDRTLILLMWISCLRIHEAVTIRFEDSECSHRSIRIANGKGGHPRTVFMDRYTFAALNTYLDEERRDLFPEVDEIFVSFKGIARGRPLTVNAVQHTIDYYAKQCDLTLHAHLFRHTGITQLVQQGMSEPAIRKLVGHTNAHSLDPYLHLSDSFVEAEFEKAQTTLNPKRWLQLAPEGGHT
jgi:integrase/recombinase XerC